jgi:hypothetical protein
LLPFRPHRTSNHQIEQQTILPLFARKVSHTRVFVNPKTVRLISQENNNSR